MKTAKTVNTYILGTRKEENMLIKKRKTRRTITWTAAGIVAIVACVGIIKAGVIQESGLISTPVKHYSYTPANKDNPNGYMMETSYNGANNIDQKLFDYEFRKSDSYINNIEYLSEHVSESTATANILNTKAAMEQLTNLAYKKESIESVKTILENEVQPYSTLGFPEDEFVEDSEYSAEKLVGYIKENKISMESEFVSDQSLVYYDDYSEIIRGELLVTFYEGDMKKIGETLGIDKMQKNKQYAIIMDVYTTPDMDYTDHSSYKIEKIDVLDVL